MPRRLTGTKRYFTVRSCISNSAVDVSISGARPSGAEIELVVRAQDDARVSADLLPEAGDIVTAGAGMDVV